MSDHCERCHEVAGVCEHCKDWCCAKHNSHETRWIESPVFGSCGEGRIAIIGCCENCPLDGQTAKWKLKSNT